MNAPHVLCLFGRPDRTSALAAIARVIWLVKRRHALSCAEIAKVIECSPDTIERALNRETMLGADNLAALLWSFEDCAEPWQRLCQPEAAPEMTIEERLQRIEREAATIRREIAA